MATGPGIKSEWIEAENIVVRFSGDSGDGMQLTGMQFSDTTAFLGNDLSTFPDYPSEIRAPSGTVAGVSAFQVHFGSSAVFTPGDRWDVLVAMNAAAFKADFPRLKRGGIVIANAAGFDRKGLSLANFPEGANPLEDGTLDGYTLYQVDFNKHTADSLKGIPLQPKEVARSKNMLVLGLLFWMFDKSMEFTVAAIRDKFLDKPDIAEANIQALKSGWNLGENMEIFTTRYVVRPASLPPGTYRNVHGNQAIAIGLMAAAEKSGLGLFLGSYPITPATDILQELSRYKSNGVLTFQAEDEIAAVCAAIGAAYAGKLATTTTSGPGLSLKTEAIGLATILEIPLVIIDVQRGGPSTGLPTKTEQADLMMAFYGRHGEAPLVVLAAKSPNDCFRMAFEACRIAIEHMTPVILLSDGYIANGAEPWRFPKADELPAIRVQFLDRTNGPDNTLLPYLRDEQGVRPWIIPGTPGLEHRIGGLEKEDKTGNVSYDPQNHEKMVRLRMQKIQNVERDIPLAELDSGTTEDGLLVVSWGSTYGAVKTAIRMLRNDGLGVAHLHVSYLNPFPANLGDILGPFQKILVPEMNSGQLVSILRSRYLVPAKAFSKVQGQPFTTEELCNAISEHYNAK
ncbi:MAG: 2-oxoacid:acceptor oxidoreductase subunit alpha [Saprospiraceae bacterium]|jgi:2-oxoglutarate ferredoxin oxidoreductase subunit alpha|nr:2-oxoacid:acceptor oxidoreductase subunit alpha [Saprospiraceae bacterium]MBP9209321.1 2-oxoacid:acceptor oxidoreductase subunit alpha [Saprospiraceae bacterium]MBV6474271.1 2-oxoglutarate oxidoreductase subunit KorA [Saprospiraceae bacterium]